MITVLYDTNIILDVLMQRQPFYVNSTLALSLSGREIVHGYIAGHAITTIDYIFQKQDWSCSKSASNFSFVGKVTGCTDYRVSYSPRSR